MGHFEQMGQKDNDLHKKHLLQALFFSDKDRVLGLSFAAAREKLQKEQELQHLRMTHSVCNSDNLKSVLEDNFALLLSTPEH